MLVGIQISLDTFHQAHMTYVNPQVLLMYKYKIKNKVQNAYNK